MRTVQFERLSWKEVASAVKECGGVAIVPVGAVEEHGPHLPVGTDSMETYAIARQAGELAGAVVLPLIPYGNSRSLLDFPGTIAIRPETLKGYVKDVLRSLATHGFKRLIVLDGHSGNYGILDVLVEDLFIEEGIRSVHVRAWELASVPKPPEVPAYDGHGGLSETSAILFLDPDSVNKTEMMDSAPEAAITSYGSIFPVPSSIFAKGAVVFPAYMGELVAQGHHGDPGLADAERGEALIRVKAQALADFISAWRAGEVSWRNRE